MNSPRDRQGVNIQTVASTAGVSKTTVSHVLSGNRPVAAATRERVERVMADLGFKPNFFAQALNSARSNSIAVVVQDMTNPYYPALARGLQNVLGGADQVLMVFDANAGTRLTHHFIADAIARRVDGVVVATSDFDEDINRLATAGIPVVAVGSGVTDLPVDWVSADDVQIGSDAVRHFVATGHRRIATISGPAAAVPGSSRLAGYRNGMNEAALPIEKGWVASGDWTKDSGFTAMSRLLNLTDRPTAVFCANDLMAIGALDAVRSHKLSVPNDFAVVGVDDIDAASLVNPSLTSIRIPAIEIGKAAGELLLRRIDEGAAAPARHVNIPHALIERESA